MYGRLAWDEAKKSVHYYSDDLDQVFIWKISEHHWAPRSADRDWFTALPDATYSHLQNETGGIDILTKDLNAAAAYTGPWTAVVDESSGDIYYWNEETEESSWDPVRWLWSLFIF